MRIELARRRVIPGLIGGGTAENVAVLAKHACRGQAERVVHALHQMGFDLGKIRRIQDGRAETICGFGERAIEQPVDMVHGGVVNL